MACDKASQIERGIMLSYHAMDIYLCALFEPCYPHIAALRNEVCNCCNEYGCK